MSLTWRFLHRWLGLSIGLVLSLVCLSGSFLLHKSSLMPLWYPELKSVLSRDFEPATTMNLAIVNTLLQPMAQGQEKPLLALVLPQPNWPLYTQVYSKTQRAYFDLEGRFLVAVNRQSDVFAWMFDLHQYLLLGELGKGMNGWVQLLSLVMLVSGVVIWLPKSGLKKALSVDLSAPRRKLWYQLHRTVAVNALALLLLMILSGVGLLYYSQTQSLLVTILGDGENLATQELPQGVSVNRDTPLKQVLAQADSLWPDITWTVLYPPTTKRPNWRLRGKFTEEWHSSGRSFMTFSVDNTNTVQLQSAKTAGPGLAIAQKLYPLHSATIGGGWYLWLLTLLGVAPLFLWLSGVYLSVRKRRKKHQRSSSAIEVN